VSSSIAIPFVKASACGNDFLLIEFEKVEGKIASEELAAFTRRICDRHEGVGADGVEWIYPHNSADVEIRLINSDGSEAEISGNGTRCVAAYVCHLQQKERISILTGAGLKTCVLVRRSGFEYEFEIEMGAATVEAELTIALGEKEARGIPVSMGNPHYVVFVKQFAEDWRDNSAAIQRNAQFKQGVNVETVMVEGPHDVQVRFFERGAGETQSSGTGSCAAAVATVSSGRAEFPVRVHAPGGTQSVNQRARIILLRGAARLLCRGEFFLS
jgi:diaminopimelate epimerase